MNDETLKSEPGEPYFVPTNSPPVEDKPDVERTLIRAPTDLLIIVFIHGFKGDDETFLEFPNRLQHVLTDTVSNCVAESIVFPAYETKGDLQEAVVRLADWLTTLTVEREVAAGGGAGSAKIVLCGHSMGGLLAADTLLSFVRSKPDRAAPLWPNIIACIAFDTPYLGLHPYVFKNTATKATQYANAAKTVGASLLGAWGANKAAASSSTQPATEPLSSRTPPPTGDLPSTSSSPWSKWAPAAYAVGGAMFAGALAGGAYYKREELSSSYTKARLELGTGYMWAMDHMKYVGNLWDDKTMHKRVEEMQQVERDAGVLWRVFYTYLPPVPLVHPSPRTFIVLPKRNNDGTFIAAKNSVAPDELQAHTGMFSGKTNDGYYELGLATAKIIREAVALGRGVFEAPTVYSEES